MAVCRPLSPWGHPAGTCPARLGIAQPEQGPAEGSLLDTGMFISCSCEISTMNWASDSFYLSSASSEGQKSEVMWAGPYSSEAPEEDPPCLFQPLVARCPWPVAASLPSLTPEWHGLSSSVCLLQGHFQQHSGPSWVIHSNLPSQHSNYNLQRPFSQ